MDLVAYRFLGFNRDHLRKRDWCRVCQWSSFPSAIMVNREQDVLELLPPSLTKTLHLSLMLRSSSDGLAALQPWITSDRNAVSEKILPIVQEVRRQSQAYHEALTLSGAVAQDGFNWAVDIEEYCNALQRGSYDTELLRGYVSLMRKGARDAQHRAQQVAGMFRAVSEGLRRVSSSAKAEVDSSLANAEASATLMVANQTSHEVRKHVTSFGSGFLSGLMYTTMVVGGAPVAVAIVGASVIASTISTTIIKDDEARTASVNSGT
ncbi:hypothetical protein GALMADRAFT_227690 [Galerina marginata CBS 339.88]|uniref:Uncharacterized protein n=1 Tax=Galerina marginata (strain CBS 339.88) TaxID=685588 RepID=A0A067SVB2_GALM3|nr:hypothetical protein GALMADRAFT_227690 [Galerina marginata CBS 339.88]